MTLWVYSEKHFLCLKVAWPQISRSQGYLLIVPSSSLSQKKLVLSKAMWLESGISSTAPGPLLPNSGLVLSFCFWSPPRGMKNGWARWFWPFRALVCMPWFTWAWGPCLLQSWCRYFQTFKGYASRTWGHAVGQNLRAHVETWLWEKHSKLDHKEFRGPCYLLLCFFTYKSVLSLCGLCGLERPLSCQHCSTALTLSLNYTITLLCTVDLVIKYLKCLSTGSVF